MGEVLALTAALCYGTTHFFNGMLSRRANGVAVAVFAQLGGTLLILVLAMLLPSGDVTASALGWGALSGVGTGLGMAFLYRGMERGKMSVVSPLSDVNAAVLPILAGVALLGERLSPLAVGGIAAGLPAIWLVSRGTEKGSGPGATRRVRRAAGVGDGLLAGAGIALTWIALAQVPSGIGLLWPLVVSRAVSAVAIIPLAVITRTPLKLPAPITGYAAVVGALGTLATLLFVLSTRQQLLAIAAVLTALYPAITVLLAVVFLRERLSVRQLVGLGCAGAAVSLIALG